MSGPSLLRSIAATTPRVSSHTASSLKTVSPRVALRNPNFQAVGRRFAHDTHESTGTDQPVKAPEKSTAPSKSSTPETTGTTDSIATTEQRETPLAVTFTSEEPIPAFEVSGAPLQLLHRSVRIYQPTRNTMQSGGAKGEKWRIDWDTLPSGGRWENPLMGWASSADYMQGTRLAFNTMEDAVRFAEKQGWDYYVQPTTVKRIPPKNYAENYVYKPNKLRIARTK